MNKRYEISNEEWERVNDLLPPERTGRKGRPRKDAAPRDIVSEQAYEIQRLRMENQLLRDFLRCAGRK